MEQNSSKFFEMVIGLIITLGVISFGIYMYTATGPFKKSVSNQMESQARMIEDSQFSAYDNHLVSGSQLLTALRRYANIDAFYVFVQKNNPSTLNFGSVPNLAATSCPSFNYATSNLSYTGTTPCGVVEAQMQDVLSPYYILPQARFSSTLIRDNSKRVTAIYFKQQ